MESFEPHHFSIYTNIHHNARHDRSETRLTPHHGMQQRSKSTKEGKEEDDALKNMLNYMGEMGWYQWYLFIWMFPFGCFVAWVYFVQIFIVATPSVYYCRIPELASLSQSERRNLSVPMNPNGKWERCKMFDVDWNQVLQSRTRPAETTPKVRCKHGWEYEYTDIPYSSVSTERNWVCKKAKNVATSQALFFIGSLVGCFSFGWMADRFGRVPALMAANLCGAIGGVATIFTSGYWDFVLSRFIVGMALDNNFMLIYILVLEYVGPSHRTWVANTAYVVYFGGGNIALPWIAYLCRNWRKTLWITSLPMFSVILAPWFMPESARWLLSRGRIPEAIRMLRAFAAINGNKIPDNVLREFIRVSQRSTEHVKVSLVEMFYSAPLRQSAICLLIVYCGNAIVYDALVRLSEAFGLDLFITYTLAAILEIPAVFLLAAFLDKFGRRNLTWLPLFLAGITILTAMFIPKGIPRVCFAVLARFLTHMAFTAETQWGTEILPTPFRASGSAALHMAAFSSCLISPFIVYSQSFWELLPLLILGVISLCIAVVALFLPETKGLEMPETIPESEEIILNNRLFSGGFHFSLPDARNFFGPITTLRAVALKR